MKCRKLSKNNRICNILQAQIVAGRHCRKSKKSGMSDLIKEKK